MVIIIGFWFVFDMDVKPMYLIAIALATFGIFYFLISYILEQFIFRKVKLIYKFITDTKSNPEKKKKLIGDEYNSLTINDVNQDVLKWAERTEKELEEMKTLENYRKNFVGNISHELKTPLFSIQGYLHTLLDGAIYDENINVDYVKRAARNTERLQTIVNDLEMINKIEDDTFKLDKTVFSLHDLVKEIFGDLKKMAGAKKIELSFKDGQDINTRVIADKDAIRQVLSNLIVNGIKYGRENGKLKVNFFEVEKKILTEVTDNGIGIEEAHIKRLFDRFYRVNTSRSRAVGGSGLGLSIVKHVIEAHGEKIILRSTPDVGTTFGFTLPKGK